MSLLCQLWSLNESIHDYKQIVSDRINDNQLMTLSPEWEEQEPTLLSSDEEDAYQRSIRRKQLPKMDHVGMESGEQQKLVLQPPPRKSRYQTRRLSSSSSSSFEFENM